MPPVQYSPRILAVIVYLYMGQYPSKQRTAQALSELFSTLTPLAETGSNAVVMIPMGRLTIRRVGHVCGAGRGWRVHTSAARALKLRGIWPCGYHASSVLTTELRRWLERHAGGEREVTGAGQACAGDRVAAGVDRSRAGASDDRRLRPGACRVPGDVRTGGRRPDHSESGACRLTTRSLMTRIAGTHCYLVTNHGLDTVKFLT